MKVLDLEGLGYFWTKIKNKFYIKPDTGIPKSDLSSEVQGSLNKADTALLTETDPIFTASPAHGISSEDIIYWDNKLEKLSAVKIIGNMYRTNVSGSGSISIQGNVGLFPVVLEAGTYTVVTDMLSNTNSYGLSVNCGGNTYTLNTTDGHIHDSREITIPANGRWSGTVIGSVAGNSMISVKIEKVADEVTEIALVGITNDYNDLNNKPTLTNYFDGAVYDSNTKRINFKNGNVIKAYIDATAFIKDGMVDNVEIENGKLIITFNTESGKEPIELDITAIFDPSNYYDKSTIDNFLDDKANVADLATVATSGEYSDLINPPTNVSDFTNDVGYLTEHQDISGKANISDLDNVAFSGNYSDLSNVPTNVSSFNNDAGYLTEHQSLSNYYTKSEADNLLDDKVDTSDLATVATSGDYNDLTNKPTIPSAQVNSDWNATSGVAQILNKPDIPSVSQVADTGTSITVGSTSYNVVTTHSPSGNANTYTAPSWSAMDNTYSELNFRTHIDDISIGVNADDELYVKSVSADRLTNGTNNKVFTASELTKLAGIAAGAEVNVLSDWNETNTSSDAFIKNKPTIPDAQIQSDWNQTDTTAKDYIKNKPNLTNNNGSLNIKPYDWYGGDINIETGFDGGNITIFGGDALYLKSGDDDIYIGGGEYTSIKLLSNTYYKNKEIAVKDDIKVTSVNGMTGAVNLSIPDDSNLVHKTGNETISGNKRFNDNIYFHGEATGEIYFNDELHESQIRLKDDGGKGWVQIIKGNGTTATTLQAALDERNNVLADWNLTTTTADDYIKNKPINVSSFNNDAGYLTEHQDISGKLDVITDLDTIRAGAALGSTAYQKPSTGIPKSDLAQSVQTSLGKADTALQQHQDLSSYADGAEYDSTNHFIYLKHGNTRLANPINANDFIKDGMVDTVAVTGGNLVITFNTDSGKLPITIPISDIFDANNYYTKTEIDNAGYITEHQSLNNYYTKSEVDTKTAKTTARSDSKLLYNGQSVEAVISNTGFSNTNNLLNNGFNMAIRSNSTNPFIGLKEGNNLWYAQAASNYFYFGPTSTKALRLDLAGNGVFQTGSVTATKIIKSGGTSSLFLKADGSVDNNTYLTSFTETDPTVPAWAKASTKPTYTAAEVGALPDTTVIPDAPGTLNTNNSTAQTVSSSESFSGTIKLHKISKTGNYNDLLNKPTIPAVDIALTNSEIDTIWNNVMN